ncbi:MAG: 30S ribosomal protein S20 [Deltaproteobacteria bacterium]|nr:30S ribosomal protein S20 [Deltaproteobacteria bacterium]
MADPVKKKKLPKGRHKSQIKRQKQSLKRHERNVSVNSTLKTAVKKVKEAASKKDKNLATDLLKGASRLLQKAVGKRILHKGSAARKISRLSKLVHALAS